MMLQTKWLGFYFFVLVYGQENPNYYENGPIVEIQDGKLEGKYMETRYGREVVGFLSIPYAKPPINELRFKDPIPIEPWTEIYKAVNNVPECPQKYLFDTEPIGTEDCLYLNVFTPQLPRAWNKPYPVMVMFHIGGLITGASKVEWYGPKYLLDKDVVLVTTNYRIGPFGFLSTQDNVVPGNMGLKDQVLVLKWVQKNIAKFSGDPNSVTIIGQSAAHYHVVSSMSRGLFHRAIMHSGSALCSWATPYNPAKENAITIAKSFNCPTNNSEEIIQCLRKIDAYDIINRREILQPWNKQPVSVFQPVVEHDHPNAFITKDPREIIMENKVNPVSYITGITSADGSASSSAFFEYPELFEELTLYFKDILHLTLAMKDVNVKEIKEFYFDEKNITKNSVQELTKLYTDGIFGSSLVESVKLQLKYGTGDIYIFYFDYESIHTILELFGIPANKYGVTHTDDMFYLFPFKLSDLSNKTLSTTDNKMIDVMTELWVNFATTGKPTLNNRNIWKPVETNNLKYLHIKNNKEIKMKNHFLEENSNFWICLLRRKDNYAKYKDCL